MMIRSTLMALALATSALLLFVQTGNAQTIVALGASDTAGKGLDPSQAYPAQLEAALRASGVGARVVNMGVSGETTGEILRRVNSIPYGTQLVIYQPGGNDRPRGVSPQETAQNMANTIAQIRARGAQVLMFKAAGPVPGGQIAARNGAGFLGPFHGGVSRALYLSDGAHMGPQGYAQVVRRILPSVRSAIGR